jgi:peptide/nickel transport system substrate-binding protein
MWEGKMHGWTRIASTLLALSILGIACAPAGPRDSSGAAGSSAPGSRPALKRITLGTPLDQDIRPSASGLRRVVVPLVHSGLTVRGDQRIRRPLVAEAVPTIENGLWRLLPDGRMETTWRIREGARWHDGVALTSEDLLFSLQVGRDREMSAFNVQAYASIEDVSTPDVRTLTISWKEPFIDADALLDTQGGGLLPKHLLEDAYRSEKASLLDLPYWAHEFVGAGPYRLRDWTVGVGMLLEANADYVLGRPKIDQIEVKYIEDANALTANLMAGTVDVTNLVGSIDHGLQLRDQWRGGTVAFNYGSDTMVTLFPQFVDPRPALVAEVQFRRALAHAIDRQELADTLVAGMSPVPHSFMSPNQAPYRDIEAAVPKYDYDSRRAAQLLEHLGYRKGPDGIYRDEANRRLELELRSGPIEQAAKPASAVADYWQRLGVQATAVRLSPQQAQDNEVVATHPALAVWSRPNDVSGLRFLHSSETRLPSNNFRVSGIGNTSRYMSPEFDALLEAYFKTVPVPERIQALGQIIRHVADQVTLVGLHYNPQPGAISDRVLNVGTEWPAVFITWNAYEWDVRS